MSNSIEQGTGNVFGDLGDPQPQIALAKAELARQISKIIEKKRLTQAQAAEALDIDQGKVSNLVRGRLAGFSTERLFRFLTKLGRDITIQVQPAHSAKTAFGCIQVITVRSSVSSARSRSIGVKASSKRSGTSASRVEP